MQSLQYDGGAALEQVDHLASVDQTGQRLPGKARPAAGVRRRRQHLAVLREAHCRGPDRCGREQVVDVLALMGDTIDNVLVARRRPA